MQRFLSVFRFVLRNKWLLFFISVVLLFSYQSLFSWNKEEKEMEKTSTIKKENVVFVVIEEHQMGNERTGFESLFDNLQTWKFDKKKEKISVKYTSWLPKENTKAILLYERRLDSFQRFSDALVVNHFPYQYYFEDAPLLTIHHIEKDGTVQLMFKGKKIEVKSGETYPDWSFNDWKLTKTTIVNHGLVNKKRFTLMED
jgi:hypothetical protein